MAYLFDQSPKRILFLSSFGREICHGGRGEAEEVLERREGDPKGRDVPLFKSSRETEGTIGSLEECELPEGRIGKHGDPGACHAGAQPRGWGLWE